MEMLLRLYHCNFFFFFLFHRIYRFLDRFPKIENPIIAYEGAFYFHFPRYFFLIFSISMDTSCSFGVQTSLSHFPLSYST